MVSATGHVIALDGREPPPRAVIGGKAWSIARMQSLGLRTPPAVVVTTDAFRRFHDAANDDELFAAVDQAVVWLQGQAERTFGDADHPLLVSVRSGAAVSMPGMMDTVLNLGINDEVEAALARESGNPRFARDTHRRFLTLYTEIVLGRACPDLRDDQDPPQWRASIVAATGHEVPWDPADQLRGATRAVFASWNSRRARRYRSHNDIPDDLGTAVTIQAMVFGNLDDRSGTGVLFSRNPLTGEPGVFGEYLARAQGEDIVSGRVTPDPLNTLRVAQPAVHDELLRAARTLEAENGEVQDIEFTVQHGRLYLLQSRAARLSAAAVIRTSVDLVNEGLTDIDDALRRISPDHVQAVLAPRLDVDEAVLAARLVRSGDSACPGVGIGRVVTDSDEAERLAATGEAVILARPTTSPEDVNGMLAARAVVTEEGGTTSHAAVISRALGVPCVVGCGFGTIDAILGTVVTVDGGAGRIFDGRLAVIEPAEDAVPELRLVTEWAASRAPVTVVEQAPAGVVMLDLATLQGGSDPERIENVLTANVVPEVVTGGAVATPAGIRGAVAAGVKVIVTSPVLPVLLAALRAAGDSPGSTLAQPSRDIEGPLMNEPTVTEVAALLDQFERSDWSEIVVTGTSFSLRSYKTPGPRGTKAGAVALPAATPAQVAPSAAPTASVETAAEAPAPPAATAVSGDRDGMIVVRAPNLGTFYRSPKPGAPCFVEVGQQVEEDTQVCLIEVMKLFTPVQAGVAGIVREILVDDADLVEFNAPLVVIEPVG